MNRLTYTLVHDLALDVEDGLQLSADIPLPGTVETVSATIRNKGDFAEYATLYLYDGNPEEGGIKIGEAITEQPIPARSSAQVEIEWLVGAEEKDAYDIHAVVHTDVSVIDINESNNSINHKVSTADIMVVSLEYENLAEDDYLVTAAVANRGSKTLEGVKVQLVQSANSQILETREFDTITSGQEVGLRFLISSNGLAEDENGKISLMLKALLPAGVEENSTDNNNTFVFALEPAPILVYSTNPSQDETQVGIQKPLSISFNMNVQEGNGFDQIKLQDDYLNIMDINKTLEGDTLTITPNSTLAHNTRYTLTIPVDALGDSYGHTLDDPYSLSFVTTTSSPEVVFAYPGSGMGSVALETEIKMQFNQSVLKGPTFGDIVMYGPDSQVIPAAVSLQGEWLYIRSSWNLNENTTYLLMIPRGAVKNSKSEAQQEDYALEFTTAVVNNDSDNSEEEQTQAYKISRQTSADGSSTAIVDIDHQSILKLKSDYESMITLDLTNEIKGDKTIQVNLTESVINQLITNKLGLNIVTGKGDIRLPADLIKSLVKEGEKSITITIAVNNGNLTANDRVSTSIYDFSVTAGGKPVTKFEPAVIVTIPLDTSKVGNTKRVIACVYDEETGSWRPVGGVADGTGRSVTFDTGHFSTYAAFETIKHFDDVTRDWAKENVEILASRSLINGTTDKTFDPEGSITRAEFTALIARSLYSEHTKSKGTFNDVAEGSWYADAVETAYALGLVSGTGMDRFEPNAKISREQLATIAYRLYRYKTGIETAGKISNTFADSQDISAFAKEAVNFVANAGIMVGSGGRFEPKRSTTRQEAAVVLYRLLEYMGEL